MIFAKHTEGMLVESMSLHSFTDDREFTLALEFVGEFIIANPLHLCFVKDFMR